MPETVKVQRPLNNPDGRWLIYDKNKKHIEHRPAHLIINHVKQLMGNDYEMYCKGAWSSIVGWGISQRVKAEDW